MASSDLIFTVKAKTDSAAASFRKLTSSILPVKKASDETAKSMAKINKTKVAPKVDESQIKRLNTEIQHLQDEMRRRLEVNPRANVRDIQSKINGIRSSIRELSRTKVEPKINTGPITRGLESAKRKAAELKTALANTKLGGLASKIGSDLSTVGGIIGGVASKVGQLGAGLGNVAKSVGIPLLGSIGVAVAGIGTALAVTGIKAIDLADQMERAKLQMDSFTHSSTVTVKLLNQIQDYADKTPFEFPELTSAAKRLLGVGVQAGKIPGQLAKIGDIAAQAGASVDDLALIFAQMTSAGRVSAEDMNQLADRGIAAWPTLAKAMGKSVGEVRKLGEQGKLGAKEVALLWESMSKGAEGSTEALAQTFSGMVSTLKDTANGVLRDIGNALLPFAKVIVPQLTKGVEGIGDKVLAVMPKVIDLIAAGLQGLLDLPGMILRGLGQVAQGFAGMVANIQDSLAGLVRGIAQALAGIPGISDEDVAGLRTAADQLERSAKASREKGGQLFAQMTEQAKKFDTAVRPLKGKIEEARKVAQQGLVLGVSIKTAEGNVSKIKGQLAKLHKQRPTPQVKADIRTAQANLRKAKANLDMLNRYKANPKLLATDLASGKVRIVKGRIEAVPKTHHTTLTAKDGVSGPAKDAARAVNNIPTKHTTTLIINRVTHNRQPGVSPGNPSLSPGAGNQSVQAAMVAPAQVTVAVRDESLADLFDIRVNQRAARAAKIIHRRDVIIP